MSMKSKVLNPIMSLTYLYTFHGSVLPKMGKQRALVLVEGKSHFRLASFLLTFSLPLLLINYLFLTLNSHLISLVFKYT